MCVRLCLYECVCVYGELLLNLSCIFSMHRSDLCVGVQPFDLLPLFLAERLVLNDAEAVVDAMGECLL